MGNAIRPNYQMRHLTTDDLEQYNQLLRYAFQVTEQELAETGWRDDEIKQSKFPVLERADVLGCFDGDNLISQIAVYPLEMNIYGSNVFHRLRDQRVHLSGIHGPRHYEAADASEPGRYADAGAVLRHAVSLFHSAVPAVRAMRSSPTKFPTRSRIGRSRPRPRLPAMCAG